MDGEIDAFLILALSVEVAPSAGLWVLAIGAARYAFLAAGGWTAGMRPASTAPVWRMSAFRNRFLGAFGS